MTTIWVNIAGAGLCVMSGTRLLTDEWMAAIFFGLAVANCLCVLVLIPQIQARERGWL